MHPVWATASRLKSGLQGLAGPGQTSRGFPSLLPFNSGPGTDLREAFCWGRQASEAESQFRWVSGRARGLARGCFGVQTIPDRLGLLDLLGADLRLFSGGPGWENARDLFRGCD